jgi:hypothetical protein
MRARRSLAASRSASAWRESSSSAAIICEALAPVRVAASVTARILSLTGAAGGAVDAAVDVVGGDTLFVDGACDLRGSRGEALDIAGDRLHGGYSLLGCSDHAVDFEADLLGGAGGLASEVLDLAGDDGESAACLAGAGRLDGGVEGEQVGLASDLGDEADHATRKA